MSDADLAAAIGRRLYGVEPTRVERLPSENNRVFRLNFASRPARVVKLASRIAACRREQRVIRSVRRNNQTLSVPPLEFTQDDLPTEWTFNGVVWRRPPVVSVFAALPGLTVADAISRGEATARAACRAAGLFAANDVPGGVLRPEASRRQSEAQVRRSVGPLYDLLPEVSAALDEVARIKRCDCDHLAHGEFYPENVLVDGERLVAVLDWETARPASPLSDLGQFTAAVAGREELRSSAAAGFFAGRPTASRIEWHAWEVFWLLSEARYRQSRGEPFGRLLDFAAAVWSDQ